MAFAIKGRIEGLKELIASLDQLGKTVRNKVLRTAVGAGTRIVLAAAKMRAKAVADSGLLWKSLGRKVKVYRQSGVVVGIVGPRKGYRRSVTTKTGAMIIRDPIRYAHLVEYGRKGSVATKTVLSDGTVVYGKKVKPARGRPFLRPAWDSTRSAVKERIIEELVKGIEAAAVKRAA